MLLRSLLTAVASLFLSLGAASASCAPHGACASADSQFRPLWVSDYTLVTTPSGVLPAWPHEQLPHAPGLAGPPQPSRIEVIRAPSVPLGRGGAPTAAMRVELHPYRGPDGTASGDVNPQSGGSSRAEVYARVPHGQYSTPPRDWPDPVGSTRWYDFSVYLPKTFRLSSKGKWLILTQWKGLYSAKPPEALAVDGQRFDLGGSHARRKLGRVRRGRWTHFVFGFHWSPKRAKGWVKVYRDGRLMVSEQRPTMDMANGRPDPIYVKQGIYQTKIWPVTHVAYFSPLVISAMPPPSIGG